MSRNLQPVQALNENLRTVTRVRADPKWSKDRPCSMKKPLSASSLLRYAPSQPTLLPQLCWRWNSWGVQKAKNFWHFLVWIILINHPGLAAHCLPRLDQVAALVLQDHPAAWDHQGLPAAFLILETNTSGVLPQYQKLEGIFGTTMRIPPWATAVGQSEERWANQLVTLVGRIFFISNFPFSRIFNFLFFLIFW